MHYTFHQLSIFVKVCEHQSITRAAEAMYLTQPAVSIQLKKLQDEFDVPLFEVIGRQLYITEFGYKVKGLAEKILETTNQIDLACDQHKGLVTGNLKIASASTGKYVIPYFLAGFMEKYPQVNIEIDVTNKAQVVAQLQDNMLDFALISTFPQNLSLESIPLMDNILNLVASAKQFESNRIGLDQLGEQPLIFRENGSATRAAMQAYLDDHNITVKRSIQLTSNEAVKQAVKAGLGMSIMPLIGMRSEIKLGSMKIVKAKGLPIVTEWNLVYSKGKDLSPAANALKEYIEMNKPHIITSEFMM